MNDTFIKHFLEISQHLPKPRYLVSELYGQRLYVSTILNDFRHKAI
jgi:hypothetical protein